MKVTFFGTRGSIAVPDKEMMEVGGNTSCLLYESASGGLVILDAGTGIRGLGKHIIKNSIEQFENIFIALSHTHWDHIQGLPFFGPAYDPRRNITISIYGKDKSVKKLEDIFVTQMQQEYFPVPLDMMGANISFFAPESSIFKNEKGGIVRAMAHNHPGGAYGYRFEAEGKVFVYCTDVEHGDTIDPGVVELSKDADLLVHDAQYTPRELKEKKGWGHSSWEQAAMVADMAGVKRLALFHHDPEHTDTFLFDMEKDCKTVFSNAFLAIEGDTVEI
jgi:phosphoribosyl 1,2-cyclic phosphodiesterase